MKYTAMIIALLVAGCVQLSTNTHVIPKEAALEIAKRELQMRDTWADRAEITVTHEKLHWSITADRIEGYDEKGDPQHAYDGSRLIIISDTGDVIMYAGGGRVTKEELTTFEQNSRELKEREKAK